MTDDKPCKLIQTGGLIAKNVRELKTRALQYYEDQQSCRFPPSYYLGEHSTTSQWADVLKNTFKNSASDVKILVGYDPIIHMQLLGFEQSEYMGILGDPPTAKFDNSVIVIHNKKRMVMVCLVTDETDGTSILKELVKLDAILKAIYFANLSQMRNSFISLIGMVICQNIDSISDLKNCHLINFNDFINLELLIITKAEWSKAEVLVNNLVSKTNQDIQSNCQGNLKPFHFIRFNF